MHRNIEKQVKNILVFRRANQRLPLQHNNDGLEMEKKLVHAK
jgi:hypothetical protein